MADIGLRHSEASVLVWGNMQEWEDGDRILSDHTTMGSCYRQSLTRTGNLGIAALRN